MNAQSRLKSAIKLFKPPVLIHAWRSLKPQVPFTVREKDQLFGGADTLFKSVLKTTRSYAEYGCGKSTIWVSGHTDARVFSVDTSQEWIDVVHNTVSPERATLTWIDCGEIGKWGRPVGYAMRQNFLTYAEAPWRDGAQHDTALIDGRFRVLCFLRSFIHACPGTKILFDDYTDRPKYHIIEELVAPEQTCGRQCLFSLPEWHERDLAKAHELSVKFEYVTD